MSIIHKTATSELMDGKECVLSDATPDRYDDIVGGFPDSWEFKNFNRNPIALLQHDNSMPIGTWSNVHTEGTVLKGRLHLAPMGTSRVADETRKLIDAKILRGVSIGFLPIESQPRTNSKKGGQHFTKCELIEASVVSIPANANATLLQCRSLGISPEVQRVLFKDLTPYERTKQARAKARRMKALAAVQGNTKAIEVYARVVAILDKELRELGPAKTKTPDARANLQRALDAIYRIKEQEVQREIEAYHRSAAGQQQQHQKETIEAFTRTARRREAEHIAMLKREGRYVDPNPPASSGNTVVWRGQKIDLRPSWRGKKF